MSDEPVTGHLSFMYEGELCRLPLELRIDAAKDAVEVVMPTLQLSLAGTGRDKPQPDALAWISDDVLMTELLARCDHGVISLIRAGELGPRLVSYMRRWRGNRVTCIGLAHRMAHVISRDLDGDEEPHPDSEPKP